VRKFRHNLKETFHEDVTKNIMFNMRSAKDKRLIAIIKDFFCRKRKVKKLSLMVPNEIFEKYKVYFCELILKFKQDDKFNDYDIEISEEQGFDLKVLREVMTSMPNIKNL
jgi:hypothetical protein